MKYIDREGNITQVDSGQDKLLRFLYTTTIGRMMLKIMIRPAISKIGGWFLDTGISKVLIPPFVKHNQIDLNQFEKQSFSSYNDFFKRKIQKRFRPIEGDESALICPCDGKLSVYPILEDSKFSIKNTEYTLENLLHSKKLAARYQGGQALVFRLTVDDYHRFCYIDSGKKSQNYRIPGVFHTVNPIANDMYPIYKENTREYSLLKSGHFGTVLMMEVGALMVGKITNLHEACDVVRGQEKGCFEFGGSTIVILLQKDTAKLQKRIWDNTKAGCETVVKMGEEIGRSICR